MNEDIFKENNSSQLQLTAKKKPGWIGMVLAGATGGAAILLSVVAGPFVVPALRKVSDLNLD